MDTPIAFHIRCEDDNDDDDEGLETRDDAVMQHLPLAQATLSRTAARCMKTAELASELQSRHASTAGNKDARLQRLLYLLDQDVESSYTKGDVDEYNGVHPICLQMDGAKPHVGNDNIRLLNERGLESGFSIHCTVQPANSPDLNKNDMSFNNSLATHASNLANVQNSSFDDIVCNVVRAFDEYPVDSLYRAYAETFAVYREILKHCGGNDFKMPHGEIRKNESNGLEIVDFYVDEVVVDGAKMWLVQNPLPNPDL